MSLKDLRENLILREGYSREVYPDTGGRRAFGVGELVNEEEEDEFPIGFVVPEKVINQRFAGSSQSAWNSAQEKAKSIGVDDDGFITALAALDFQLGPGWNKEHKRTWALLKEGRYQEASVEVADSDWFRQTPKRAVDFQSALSDLARSRGGRGSSPKRPGGSALSDLPRSYTTPSVEVVPKESEGYYSLMLPDGKYIDVRNDLSEPEAYEEAREMFPLSFYGSSGTTKAQDVDENSSPLDAFLSTAARTTTGLLPGLKAAYATAIGDEEMYDAAQKEIHEATLWAAEIAPSLTSTKDISDLWNKGEHADAVGKAFEFGTEQIGSSFGFQVPSAIGALGGYGLAAAGLASGIAPATLGVLTGLSLMYATFLSSDIERAATEGAADTDDVNLLKVMAGAGGQTALNSLSYLLLGGGSVAKGVFGAGLSKEAKDIALGSFGKMLNKLDAMHPVKQAAALLLEEEVAEVGQQALERMAAGLTVDPRNEQARDEYVQVMLATLAPGIGFGTGKAGMSALNTAAERNSEGYATRVKALSGESGGIASRNYGIVKRSTSESFQALTESIEEEPLLLAEAEAEAESDVSVTYIAELNEARKRVKADVAEGKAREVEIAKINRKIVKAREDERKSYAQRIKNRNKEVKKLTAKQASARAKEVPAIQAEIDRINLETEKLIQASREAPGIEASARVDRLRAATKDDITATASSRKIAFDNDAAFMVWMSQVIGPDGSPIGKYEIDSLDAEERISVLRLLENIPVQETETTFLGASEQKAESVFREALGNQRGVSSPVKIGGILNLPRTIDAKTRKDIIQNHFQKMLEMGLVEKSGGNFYAKTGLTGSLEEQYQKVAPLIRNGKFPSAEEIAQKTGILDPVVVEDLRIAHISRAELGYTPAEFSKQYRLSINGVVDESASFATIKEAQEAANSVYSGDVKSVEVLEGERRLPYALRQPAPDKSITIVEQDGDLKGVSEVDYKVSSRATGAWEVLDSDGSRVALRSSEKKAKEFTSDTGRGRNDLIVDGETVGSARTRPAAQKLKSDWLAGKRSAEYDRVYNESMSQSRRPGYTQSAREADAKRAATKAAKGIEKQYVMKIQYVPNGLTISKVDGFTVTEQRQGEDGRSSDKRITEVFPTSEEASSFVSESIAKVKGPRFFDGVPITAPTPRAEASAISSESARADRDAAIRNDLSRATGPRAEFPAESVEILPVIPPEIDYAYETPLAEPERTVGAFDPDAIAPDPRRTLDTVALTKEERELKAVEEAVASTAEKTGQSPIGPFGAGRPSTKTEQKAKEEWRRARVHSEAEQGVIGRLDALVAGVEAGEIILDPNSDFLARYNKLKLNEEQQNVLLAEAALDSPGDRAEWISDLEKVASGVSRRMGLPVKIKLYEKRGAQESGAEFLTESMVIQTAVGSDLEGKTKEEQFAAIEPYVNHEFIHVSRRLGLIKASEWKKLSAFVEKTKIPVDILAEINAAQRLAGQRELPSGTTYLDWSVAFYADEGTHKVDSWRDRAAFDRGEITQEQHEALKAERAKRNWIRDDYVEEAVARLFQDYTAQGKVSISKANRTAPDVEKVAFKRILNWFRQVGSGIKRKIAPSVEDIFSTFAAEGELKSRLDRGKALDSWWLRRVDSAEYERLREFALSNNKKFPNTNFNDKLIQAQAKAEGAEDEGVVFPEGQTPYEFAQQWVADPRKSSPETRKAIDVFHGTPHQWKENPRLKRVTADIQRVGTGEGNQAFSWGFYTAESPFVAEGYRRALSSREGTEGAVYGLTLDVKEESLLDLDRSISEQSIEVQRALLDLGLINQDDNLDALNGQDMYVRLVKTFQSPDDSFVAGDTIETTSSDQETLRAASETLLEVGVPGVRFLDGMSRQPELNQDTHNYVMFSDEHVYVDPVRTDLDLIEGEQIGRPYLTVNRPVLAPASADPRDLKSRDQDLDSYTWGEFSSNRFGNKGNPARVIVKEGYATRPVETGKITGMGKRLLDYSNPDVQMNTTFSNWEDLIAGAFQRISPQLIKSGEFVVTSPEKDKSILIWKDPKFEQPVAITLDYVSDPNSDVSGNSSNDYWSVVGLRADGLYSLAPDPYSSIGELRGPDVSASAVAAAERPDLVTPMSPKEIKRYSLDTSTADHDPETQAALDTIMGDLPNPKTSFWSRITAGLPDVSTETIDKLRSLYLDNYNALWRTGKEMSKEENAEVSILSDTSAHAGGMAIGRSAGMYADMLYSGGIEFQTPYGKGVVDRNFDGTARVMALPLTNNADGVVVGFNPEDPTQRRTIDVSLSREDGYRQETGGLIPILQIIGTPSKNLLREFFVYARSLRALRLREDGRAGEKDWSYDKLARNLKLAETYPEIGVVHRNLQNWNNKLVQFLVNTQSIPEWMGEEWMKYGDYTPYYVDTENMKDTQSGSVGDTLLLSLFGNEFDSDENAALANALVTGTPSEKLKNAAGEDIMMEPLEAISKNTMKLLTVGLKNVARNRAIRDQEAYGVPDDPSQPNLLARKLDGPRKDAVRTIRNGEIEYWDISDRALHVLLSSVFDGKSPVLGPWGKRMGKISGWLREGVTRMPNFIVKNTERDSVNAWALGLDAPDSPFGLPVLGAMKRYGRNLRLGALEGDSTEEYKILGSYGSVGGYDLMGLDPKKLKRITEQKIEGKKGPGVLGWKIWDAWGEAGNRSEATVREQIYMQVLAETKHRLRLSGYTDEAEIERVAMSEGAHQAKEILNFNRRGSDPNLQFWIAALPFFNAKLQGIDRLGRAFVHNEGLDSSMSGEQFKRVLKRRMLWLSAISGLMQVWNYGDEDYEDLRKEKRDDNWLLQLPKWGPEGTPRFVSSAIPFELGILTKVIPEQIARSFMKYADGVPVATIAEDLGSTAFRAAVVTLSMNPIPQAIRPFTEAVVFNRNTYAGRDIIPKWMEKVEPFRQRTSRTGSTAIGLRAGLDTVTAGLVDLSPLQIEHLMRGYLGTLGTYSLMASDMVIDNMTPFGKKGQPVSPGWNRLPFLSGSLHSGVGGGEKSRYYEGLKKEVSGVVATLNRMKGDGDYEEAREYRKANSDTLRKRGLVKAIDKKLRRIRERRDRIIRRETGDSTKNQELNDLRAIERDFLRRLNPR